MRIPLLARAHAGALIVLFVLTALACLLVSGLPRATQAAFDRALQRSLTDAPAVRTDLTVAGESRSPRDDLHEPAAFAERERRLRALLPATLRPLVAPDGHMSAKTTLTPVTGTGGNTYINLGWLSDADRRVDWVAGRAPGAPSTTRFQGQQIPLFEVGVVEEALDQMNLRLGDTRTLGESDFAAVRIVGVFRAKDPADRYWTHNTDILHVTKLQPPGKLDFELHTTALIPDAGLAALSGESRNLTYRWVLPLNGRAASALAVPGVEAGVAELERVLTLQATTSSPYRLETGLPKVLGDFTAALATAQTVMYLLLAGLLAVALGVIVLGVRLLTDRLDRALALARARGGSLRQVAGTGAALTAAAVVPAALAGYALAFLVPGPVLPLAHLGPAFVLVAGVGFGAARVALAHRTPLHERRDDVAAARPSARRITVEALVVVLALTGAYLLRARGLSAQAGLDPFLLLVPIALTLAAALVTVRCYPYPLRLLVRLAARGRAAVPFLGLTRAARARAAGGLPVLILLPALSVSVFAAVISDGITGTQRLASWQQVGAPIKITSTIEIPAATIDRIRATPGVEQVVTAQTARVQLGYTSERAEAIAVDVAQWRRLLAGAPIDLPELPGGPSALVSPELRDRGTLDVGWQSRIKARVAGVVDAVPGFYRTGKFLVLPLDTLTRPAVNTLLIKGDLAPGELARLVPSATVESQEGALAAIQGDPLTGAVLTTLVVVTAALALYALVAVILSLVVGAADRARAVAFLRTLGLSDRQAQRLTMLEVLPMVLVTALVGFGLGLALPAALGPGVDLSAYAGDLPVGGYSPDLLTPGALAAGLALVAVLGAYAHTALHRRRGLGAALRAGDLS
ncbi:FtsX-like permease family protein [Nonomuraea bangladeshensis]|uniref:FtsX-like permease family protein n=1 Tax=Nonomuraea bangladeshensis TaxID=404385 RepID=A0ABV3H4U5_9ACTN